jgi:AraC-like DNA-binding protein
MAYLTWCLLARAALLLQDTDPALPSIAANVGYASPVAFSLSGVSMAPHRAFPCDR